MSLCTQPAKYCVFSRCTKGSSDLRDRSRLASSTFAAGVKCVESGSVADVEIFDWAVGGGVVGFDPGLDAFFGEETGGSEGVKLVVAGADFFFAEDAGCEVFVAVAITCHHR